MQLLKNPDNIQIIYKNNVPFNILFNNKYLHSKYDPYKESERQFIQFIKNIGSNINFIICYKIGLGYFIEQLIKNTEYKIIWIEPNSLILEKAIERLENCIENFKEILNVRIKLYNIFNKDFINLLYKEIILYEIFYLKNAINSNDLILIDLFNRKKFYYQVNYNTAKKFEKIWLSNFYKNLVHIKKIKPLSLLENLFYNSNALIVCGGPSLDKWIKTIKNIQNNIIIICVDTALNTLLKNNIMPDFVITVDAQLMNYLHLENHLKKSLNLICDPVVYYLTIKNSLKSNSNIFVFNNSLPYVNYVYNKIFSNFPFLKSGGSVSTTALDFAKFIGCSNIFFVGLDFGFPEKIIHTKFSIIESRMIYHNYRLLSLEHYNYKQISYLPKRFCIDLNNNKVLTNDKLLIFKNWFEKNYHIYKNLNLYLLYGNGCILKNFNLILTEEEIYKKIKLTANKKIKLNSIDHLPKIDSMEILENLYKEMKQIYEVVKAILLTIENYLKNPEKINPNIEHLFHLEQKLFSINLLNMLPYFEPINFGASIDENFKITYDIYSQLEENIKLHIYYLEKSMLTLQFLE